MISPRGELPASDIEAAVQGAGLSPLAAGVAERFSVYFALLQRWNSKLNLTAIRDADGILRRHFLECIFCAQSLPPRIGTLLDYGSGAGFPGIPIALCRPDIRVTLAESQGKKASFLREAVRTLGIAVEVHSGRVEELEPGRAFGAVALRAVDKMPQAIAEAVLRIAPGGWLVMLATHGSVSVPEGFASSERAVPGSENGVLVLAVRGDVPRGTSL